MLTEGTISSFVSDWIAKEPEIDISSIFDLIRDRYDISNATYFGTGIPGGEEDDDVIITTYSADWFDRYVECNYASVDPVISRGVRSILPIDWAEIPKLGRPVRQFFGEAKEFGVHPLGLTVPVRGVHGETGLFSVNVDVSQRDWDEYRDKHIADITYTAFLIHNHVLEQKLPAEFQEDCTLTDRERAILLWAARGKSAWETGEILGLTEKTVHHYTSNACAKLGAATKVQAVARAVSRQIICY